MQGLLKPAESKNVPEEIDGFRKAFDDLLKKAGINQLIVLIDDLDRCLPDTAIETLEAVRLFLFTSRTDANSPPRTDAKAARLWAAQTRRY